MTEDPTLDPMIEGSVAAPERPDATGQMIFSIVNIIISILMCCCVVGIIPLIFGILAAIYGSESKKARTRDEAEARIRTALLLNIISLVSIIICLAVLILSWMWIRTNIDFRGFFRKLNS